jgi:hypothetical protein
MLEKSQTNKTHSYISVFHSTETRNDKENKQHMNTRMWPWLVRTDNKLTCHQFISSHLLASQLQGKKLWKRKGCNYIRVIIGGWYTKISNLIKKIGQNIIHEIIQTNTPTNYKQGENGRKV